MMRRATAEWLAHIQGCGRTYRDVGIVGLGRRACERGYGEGTGQKEGMEIAFVLPTGKGGVGTCLHCFVISTYTCNGGTAIFIMLLMDNLFRF